MFSAGASEVFVTIESAVLRLGMGKRSCRCPWGCGGEAALYGLVLGPGVVRQHQLQEKQPEGLH